MASPRPRLDPDKHARLREGVVIPAHPLALNADRTFDVERQEGLTRYYLECGVGGLAVGVHTTQFAIRSHGLYRPVLSLAAQQASAWRAAGGPAPIMVAGVLGPSEQARAEAQVAAELGYDLALVAMNGWADAEESVILDGIAAVAGVLPVFGFYLQPAIGRRRFGFDFWRRFVDIDGVRAIKVAPFDRYATLDVVRAVVEGGRAEDIALYTGNDDAIVADLITPLRYGDTEVRIVGGLLGQWAVGTAAAVRLHRRIRELVVSGADIPAEVLALGAALTDVNSAVFDVANGFHGSVAGINHVLARAGRLRGDWCLDPAEALSPGQAEAIDRVLRAYPELVAT